MPRGPGGGLIRSIQSLYDDGAIAGLDDAGLLSRYLDRGAGSHAAFEAIVTRHGTMVHHVCRAVTGSDADADDAFQAVFLILASHAASVRRRGSLGPWLFGVARRTAMRARRQAARRREVESRAGALSPTAAESARPDDSVLVLIEEVDRLPSRYREPVVLCHLQGLTYEAAAARLGCPSSTLGVRLKRGRDRLRARLECRGIDSPVVIPPTAAIPEALAASTSRLALLVSSSLRGDVPVSVLTLTRGALRIMRMTRMISTSAAFLALAAGAWAWNASASSDGAASAAVTRAADEGASGKYRMAGRVTDPETGEAVAGATIRVTDGYRNLEARSGPDGTYILPVQVGDVDTRSIVPPPGYWLPGGPFDLSPLSVSDARPEARVDFQAVRGVGWEFRLSWAADGKPASRANLYGNLTGGTARAVADDGGGARVGLPGAGGEVTITAEPPGPMGWTSAPLNAVIRWDGRFDPGSLAEVVRLNGNVARFWLTDRAGRAAMIEDPEGGRFTPRIEAGRLIVDVAFPPLPAEVLPDVVGSVVDGEGRAIEGASVALSYVWEHEGGGMGSSTVMTDRCRGTTDENGRYRLADVPAHHSGRTPTSLSLSVSRPGFVPVDVGPVRLPAEGPVQMPTAVLAPGHSFIGVVVDPDGKPVVGAMVRVSEGITSKWDTTRTDESGRFRVGDLSEASFGLFIRYGDLCSSGKSMTAARDPKPVEIQLSRPSRLDPTDH